MLISKWLRVEAILNKLPISDAFARIVEDRFADQVDAVVKPALGRISSCSLNWDGPEVELTTLVWATAELDEKAQDDTEEKLRVLAEQIKAALSDYSEVTVELVVQTAESVQL